MLKLFTLVLLLLGRGDVAWAENWPEFRGPTGQGIVARGSLPVEWGPMKNVAWKEPIPGLGWSSPIIWEGRIFLTTSVPTGSGDDQSLRTLCLDAKTGKVIWDKEVFHQDGKTAPRIHRKNSHASPSPTTDGERIYVHFGHQGTAALDLKGEFAWKNTSLRYKPVHGNGGAPILVDDLLVFSCDGLDDQFVIALNKATGKEVWRTKRRSDSIKKFAFSTPLLIVVDGQKQIVSPGAGAVCGYDAATGKEIWRVNTGEGYSVVPRPVFGHGLVFVCSGFDIPELLAIRPNGTGDVTKTHVAWTLKKGASLTPSVLLVGDELYLVSDLGIGSCLDAKTGKVHWQQRLGGGHSASPVFADGKLYFQSEDGPAVVLKAGTKFELLARNNLDERTLASYAVADGALFIRTEKHLYRIEGR